MKNHVVPFAVGFVIFVVVFLGLDIAMMHLQGLSLIFAP